MEAVKFDDVWEMYQIEFSIEGKHQKENFWALRGISFALEQGEALGVIGENGSGKSTLLKIVAGIMKPSRGAAVVSGRAAGLLDLGAGFQADLTGRENIYLNANLFGLSRKKIDDVYQQIEDFASLGKFICAPVSCYSQGMFVRLSFAIAIHMDPDVLVIDDTLSVGDEYFQNKCLKKIFELKENKKTIVFATHDMSLLKKLSRRALFLKGGRIISDSSVHESLSLYIQTAGTGQEVGVLQKEALKIIFNQGRLLLNWNGQLITPQPGIFARFFAQGRWYQPSEASWRVEQRDDTISAEGDFYRLDLKQIWNIQLLRDGQVVFSMRFEGKGLKDVEERCVTALWSSDYQQWLTLIKNGKFPDIPESQTEWNDVAGDDLPPVFVGLMGKDDGSAPPIVIEQIEPSASSKIKLLNTDYFAHARTIEYREKKIPSEDPDQNRGALNFFGKIAIARSDIKEYTRQLADHYGLARGDLKFLFHKGQWVLFFKETRLTKSRNFVSMFWVDNVCYSSEWASWSCRKDHENKLIARGVFPDSGITQIWTLELKENNSFSWRVALELKKEVDIGEQYLRLMFSEAYDLYDSPWGGGFFAEHFQEHEVDILQKSVVGGEIALKASDDKMPGFSLKEISRNQNTYMKIFNTDLSFRARDLRVGRVEPERETRFGPGHHDCFEVVGAIAPSILGEGSERVFKRDPVSFVFFQGGGKLFFQGREITKKMGLCTSLRYQGRWLNSYLDAKWVTAQSEEEVLFSGEWRSLPVLQKCRVSFEGRDTIIWKAELEVIEKVCLEQLQTNIMLSELYNKWTGNGFEADMPPFEEKPDEWPVIWSSDGFLEGAGGLKEIRASSGTAQLPEIRFTPEGGVDMRAIWNIMNSDICHRGRLLKLSAEPEKGILWPGRYCFCDIKISLGKDAG